MRHGSIMLSALTAMCAAVLPSPTAAMKPVVSASAGDLMRVTHRVNDVAATAAFYKAALGLEEVDVGSDGTVLCAAGGNGLGLELVCAEDAAFRPELGSLIRAGYLGLSARVPSVADAVAAATAAGGSVLQAAGPLEHGPSYVPLEEDEESNFLVEATVADPSGYALVLHECEAAPAACLSGARMGVYEWKRSQEWCAHAPSPSPPIPTPIWHAANAPCAPRVCVWPLQVGVTRTIVTTVEQ